MTCPPNLSASECNYKGFICFLKALKVEAVNSDSLRNSIRLLRHKGIVSDDSQLLQSGQAEAMQAELLRLLAVQ
ncbi:unnamed protein product [Heligmosomoides polygyrus]|uniref:PTS sugar transporter subunit IIA n=1 Tax=Heligmosomoides polygyrus TaxID=6339 RepID=A0A183G7D0_HELPZ|nr:unnamed protein product [Heligmosomoides polygyrus]